VVAITDNNGSILSQQRYLPFGQVRTDVGTVTQTDLGFTGQRNNSGLGLMDYHARDYDPALGRFIQPDTIVPSAISPQSWNRYSYVYNDPVGLSDPSGHGNNCHSQSGYRCRIAQSKMQNVDLEGVLKKLKQEKAYEDYCKNNPGECFDSPIVTKTKELGKNNCPPQDVDCSTGGFATGSIGSGNNISDPYCDENPNDCNKTYSGNSDDSQTLPLDPIQSRIHARYATTIQTIPPSPFPCEWIDCGLSVASTIASTLELIAPIAPEALAADIFVTVWADMRTQNFYDEGKITNVNRWANLITSWAGLIPGPTGIAFSVINNLVVFSGYPH
jgi:RHS repeat-associated protein